MSMNPRMNKYRVAITIIVAMILLSLLIIPLSAPNYGETVAQSIDLSRIFDEIPIYYVEYVPQRLLDLFVRVGLAGALKPLDFENIGTLDKALVFTHPDTILRDLGGYTERFILLVKNCMKCVFVYVNFDPKPEPLSVVDSYSAVFKALGSIDIELILPLSPEQLTDDKYGIGLLHPAIGTADLVAFTVNPPGVVIAETIGPYNFYYVLAALLEWSELVDRDVLLPKARVPHNLIMSGPTNMVYLGYIGWISDNTYGRVCREVTGTQLFYTRYYYGNVTAADGTLYHEWYVYTQHSGVGYQTRCGWWTINHYPRVFETIIHWRTDTYPGQVLDDWQPKNPGSARVITYNMTAGVEEMSVSVQYSTGFTEPNTPYFTWLDYSNPALGRVRIRHLVERGGFSVGQMSNILFTVEPRSFGFLDPRKPGGVLPMIIYQSFYMELNTGDNVNVTFGVSLPTTSFAWIYS